jgi:hypothetical protein
MGVNIIPLLPVPWPPILPAKLRESKWCVPDSCRTTLLPLREMAISHPITAAAAQVWSDIVSEYNISRTDMALVYMSPDPYHKAFEEVLDLVVLILPDIGQLASALLRAMDCLS